MLYMPNRSSGPFAALALLSLVDVKEMGHEGLAAKIPPTLWETVKERLTISGRLMHVYEPIKLIWRFVVRESKFIMQVARSEASMFHLAISRDKIEMVLRNARDKDVPQLAENFSKGQFDWKLRIKFVYTVLRFMLIENDDQLEVALKLLHRMTKTGHIENIDWNQSHVETVVRPEERIVSFCIYEREQKTTMDILSGGVVNINSGLSVTTLTKRDFLIRAGQTETPGSRLAEAFV